MLSKLAAKTLANSGVIFVGSILETSASVSFDVKFSNFCGSILLIKPKDNKKKMLLIKK